MKLLLARHGQTPWNTELRTQGRTDIPLSEIGQQQAQLFAARLATHALDAIYTSPLSRAQETAAVIAAPHGLTPRPSPLLLERDFGSWEGEPYAKLKELYPDQAAAWERDPVGFTPPGAEPLGDVLARCTAFLELLRTTHAYEETILVVGHSVPLRLFISILIGLPASQLHCIRLDNTAYTQLHLGRKRNTLLVLNDTSHLGGLL